MEQFIDLIVQFINYIKGWYEYDMEMFKYLLTSWWNYATLCIPTIGYLIFFLFKWTVIFIPFKVLFGGVLNKVGNVIPYIKKRFTM